MSSKGALWEDMDIQKAISPFLKKSRHQAYIWELEELSPLPPEAEFFFLKHEKRRGLIRKSGNGGLFYSTPSGSLQKPEHLCCNNMTPSGSGREVELQYSGGENVIYLNQFGFLQSIQMTSIRSGHCNSFRFTR
jgi:hypothetical protein